jgi:hypothetical protein
MEEDGRKVAQVTEQWVVWMSSGDCSKCGEGRKEQPRKWLEGKLGQEDVLKRTYAFVLFLLLNDDVSIETIWRH